MQDARQWQEQQLLLQLCCCPLHAAHTCKAYSQKECLAQLLLCTDGLALSVCIPCAGTTAGSSMERAAAHASHRSGMRRK